MLLLQIAVKEHCQKRFLKNPNKPENSVLFFLPEWKVVFSFDLNRKKKKKTTKIQL